MKNNEGKNSRIGHFGAIKKTHVKKYTNMIEGLLLDYRYIHIHVKVYICTCITKFSEQGF